MHPHSPTVHSEVLARLRASGCVFADDEAQLLVTSARTPAELASWVRRRAAGVPLEHVLGWVEFAGLRIGVEPGVFVPRRRTELLARLAVSVTRPHDVLVDLCCGSGAIASLVAASVEPVELHLVDLDALAVRCARRNLGPHAAFVQQGDLYAALPVELRGRIDVLAVNAPYVPTSQIRLLPPEARDHEPTTALDGGVDGLDVQRRVIAEAWSWLAPGGHFLIETSSHLVAGTEELVAASGLNPQVVREQELDATVVMGRKPDREPGR